MGLDARRLMAENEAQMRQLREQEGRLRRAAEEELGRIDSRLMAMPHGKVANDSAQALEYRMLVEQKGRLLRQVAAF